MPPARRSTARTAHRFATWLNKHAATAGHTQTSLRAAWADAYPDERTPSSGQMSKWFAGNTVPYPATVIRFAHLLGADPDDALRNAGYKQGASSPHAQRWSQWLVKAAESTGHTPQTIIAASDGTLDAEILDGWYTGRAAATPAAAVLVGRILGIDPYSDDGPLANAGHDDLARQIRAVHLHTDPAVRALSQRKLPERTRRALIREYELNKARGINQAAEILRLKAEAAEHGTPDRDAL